MVASYEFVPAYVSPLTDAEHARIGRIAILWGQVESSVDDLMAVATPFSTDELAAVNILGKSVGGKVEFLKACNKRQKEGAIKNRINEFCTIIDNTKIQRNHVFHGVWGWRGNSKSKTVEPCARNAQYPSKPLKIADLARLEKQLCKASRLGFNLMCQLRNWEGTARLAQRIYFSEPECPVWLRQWTKRNVLCDANLDHNAREGQLPRLSVLLPHK